jgi:hypothetical protein
MPPGESRPNRTHPKASRSVTGRGRRPGPPTSDPGTSGGELVAEVGEEVARQDGEGGGRLIG